MTHLLPHNFTAIGICESWNDVLNLPNKKWLEQGALWNLILSIIQLCPTHNTYDTNHCRRGTWYWRATPQVSRLWFLESTGDYTPGHPSQECSLEWANSASREPTWMMFLPIHRIMALSTHLNSRLTIGQGELQAASVAHQERNLSLRSSLSPSLDFNHHFAIDIFASCISKLILWESWNESGLKKSSAAEGVVGFGSINS